MNKILTISIIALLSIALMGITSAESFTISEPMTQQEFIHIKGYYNATNQIHEINGVEMNFTEFRDIWRTQNPYGNYAPGITKHTGHSTTSKKSSSSDEEQADSGSEGSNGSGDDDNNDNDCGQGGHHNGGSHNGNHGHGDNSHGNGGQGGHGNGDNGNGHGQSGQHGSDRPPRFY